MIDAVITYVDGSDEKWLEKYRSKVTKPIEETETRYRSYDCLDLQVRLIRKFMKFVDNIFIVVDSYSQVEKYSFTEEDNVTIVTHEEIIPKRYLPCFNSCAIEMFFYNIKDLKENFVYFNDDFFVTNECEESDFFINGKPCLTFIEKNIVLEDNDSIFDHNIVNSCEILKNNFPVKRNRYKCVKPSHFILPLKKSAYTYIWTKCFNDVDKSLTRTRHRRNYNVYLFANYEYYVRSYINRQLNSKYYTTITWPKQIYDDIKKDNLKSICINDIYIYDFIEWKTEFKRLLNCLLNDIEYVELIKPEQIISSDKIYVTFTSWKNRINDCRNIVKTMTNQTMKPTKIILNLSEEEFPNKENDLPEDLFDELKSNILFEIYWVKENYKQFKKLIHTLNRFPNDIVISIDDDYPYPNNFIETLYNDYIENGRNNPISYSDYLNKDGDHTHHGSFTITESKFYGCFLNDIFENFIYKYFDIYKCYDDPVYTIAAKYNGYEYKEGSVNYNKLRLQIHNDTTDALSKRDKTYSIIRNEFINALYGFCKKYDKVKSYKKVVYTCITGNYDNLLEPMCISNDFDYICFSDNEKLISNTWKILPIPSELNDLSKVKQQRNIKINAHKYLSEYDLSIWVDSSVKLGANINDVIYKLDFDNYNVFIPIHPQRKCIYEEGKACIKLKKDTKENINKELSFFENCGMPQDFCLYETNVMIRLHNEYSCIALMDEWWYYLNLYSHRDQISLPFCIWRLNYDRIYALERGFNHTKYFNWMGGLHKKINICIIHYNTPELTNCLIKSINKYVKRAYIYLFDNSTTKPFTYTYDNMVYLDNTQGQYINFDKWLENYPNRFMSKEAIGNCGSARHSITVEKCMEIIDENFILMDSDILLKRDVSGFINQNFIYVGQSAEQPNGKYRVLPFCLFINVNMCKKYGIHWFDENYMHGLYVTKEADKYDTGGAFYVHTRDYPTKEVNLDSFIVHYKGGSWEERHMAKYHLTLTSKEWLEMNKKYWE